MNRRRFLAGSAASLVAAGARPGLAATQFEGAGDRWLHYGGDAGASRYSPLGQINRFNVHRLKRAWTHHTGDKLDRPATMIQ